LDFYSASFLKQQSMGKYFAPLGHIILILSQPAFTFTSKCYMLSGEAANTNFKVFSLTETHDLQNSELSMITIWPLMWLLNHPGSPQAPVAWTSPLFSNFLFTNLFSIKFLYYSNHLHHHATLLTVVTGHSWTRFNQICSFPLNYVQSWWSSWIAQGHR
jgi:hypothetical protein